VANLALARDGGAGSGFKGFLALTEGLGASSGSEARRWRRADLDERGAGQGSAASGVHRNPFR
jgi:hypothetical protein